MNTEIGRIIGFSRVDNIFSDEAHSVFIWKYLLIFLSFYILDFYKTQTASINE